MNRKSYRPGFTRGVNRTAALAIASMFGISAGPAQAADVYGLEFSGYTRGGVFSGIPRGGYTLGGDLQKFRLGNEGDNGIEIGFGKMVDAGNGMKWGMMYMPAVWNGTVIQAQAYAMMSGLDFAPEAKFWAGQRRLRLQEIHIVDHFVMDYGENTGAGVTDLNLGFARMGFAISNAGNFTTPSTANDARRYNLDLSEIAVNAGGKLRMLATVVQGKFQLGKPGYALSLSHDQTDFLMPGLNNTLFLQGSTGHAGLTGKFEGLGDANNGGAELPGRKAARITDAVVWQSGVLGGQALLSYETAKVDGGPTDGRKTRDISLGGRVSYAVGRNFKWLVEAGSTSRALDGQATQRLEKFTLAPTLAVAPGFWSRPEMRFYVTHVRWNDAAAAANSAAGGFGNGGKTSSTIAGVQMEAWW